ncbi:MAG: hypothetical protein KKF56_02495 [Nanoarchaeota archaeon]|nr:hypothetical protein [Nanoarchaeota archaeon]
MGIRSGVKRFGDFSKGFPRQVYGMDYDGIGDLLSGMEKVMRGTKPYVRGKLLEWGGGVPREVWEAGEVARMENDVVRVSAQAEVVEVGGQLCDRINEVALLQSDLQTAIERARYFEGKYEGARIEVRGLTERNGVLEDRHRKLVDISKLARMGRIRAFAEVKDPYVEALEKWKTDYAGPLEDELLRERRLSRASVGHAVIGAMEVLFNVVPDVQNAPVIYYDFVGNRGIATRAASELLGIPPEKLNGFRLAELLRGLSGECVEDVRYAVKHSNPLLHFEAQTFDGTDLFLSTYPVSQQVKSGRPPRRVGMGVLLYHPKFRQDKVGWIMQTARVSRSVAKNVQGYFSNLEEYFARLAGIDMESKSVT